LRESVPLLVDSLFTAIIVEWLAREKFGHRRKRRDRRDDFPDGDEDE
jgi:hypothetical protein